MYVHHFNTNITEQINNITYPEHLWREISALINTSIHRNEPLHCWLKIEHRVT